MKKRGHPQFDGGVKNESLGGKQNAGYGSAYCVINGWAEEEGMQKRRREG